jgi:nicotinamidase-related amidase
VAAISLVPDDCALLLVDVQDPFMQSIWEAERVVSRVTFLAKVAVLMKIPVFATAQNPGRLGPIIPSIAADRNFSKMSFSCWKDPDFQTALNDLGRRKIVVAGVETHICVGLTIEDLLRAGYEVAVCPDAVSASNVERHKLGMERIRDAGAAPVHSEAVAYEWMQTAAAPPFKEMLGLVKQYR